MRFEEVTDRLGAPVSYPGDRDDGKPLNVAIPHLRTMRVWQAVHGGYSWAIVFEPGLSSWTDEERKEFVGYTASYRRVGHLSSRETIRIDGVWQSFAAAEAACRRTWRQIRSPS